MIKCSICGKEKIGKVVLVNHHIDYENDITTLVCRPCHNWLHGRTVYGHPFFKEFGKDKAPLVFAQRVVKEYKRAFGKWILKKREEKQ